MITVHHLNNSRSQRILWMLEELGVAYEITAYARDRKTMLAPPELKHVHPLGKAPVITDGKQTIAESGAILTYLVETYGPAFVPAPGTDEHRRYTYWMHYAEGSLMPLLLLKLIFDKLERGKGIPWLVRPVARAIAGKLKRLLVKRQLKDHLAFLEGALAQSPWFAGQTFSAADVQLGFPLEAAAVRGGLDAQYPQLQDYLARIHARPAYLRALERGGRYEVGR